MTCFISPSRYINREFSLADPNVPALRPFQERGVRLQVKPQMTVTVNVVSSHPVLTSTVETLFAHTKGLTVAALSADIPKTEVLHRPGSLQLFLLDACSLRTNLGPLAARLRSVAPGSKCLALLPPGDGDHAEEIRLFYWGIDGFVELRQTWRAELPQAIHAILKGQPWVPSAVLLAFVKNAKALIDAQLLPGHSLTGREAQVLQLLMRRLTNKEIGSLLAISERTVKFHVSNILCKLQLDDRADLSPDKFALKPLAS
jgi:DNA-binding NarL/FixJ family response regulator